MQRRLPFLYDANAVSAKSMGTEFQLVLGAERKKGLIDGDLLPIGNTNSYVENAVDPKLKYLYGPNVYRINDYDKTTDEADEIILNTVPKTKETEAQQYINFMSPLKIDQNLYDVTTENETELPQDGILLAAQDIQTFENSQRLDVDLIKAQERLPMLDYNRRRAYDRQQDMINFYNNDPLMIPYQYLRRDITYPETRNRINRINRDQEDNLLNYDLPPISFDVIPPSF